MNRFLKLSLVLLLPLQTVLCQSVYIIDSISPDLRAGANAVIRSNQERFDIVNENKVIRQIKTIIALLNEDAEDFLFNALEYDDYSKISDITANAYDKDGKLFWSLSKINIQDQKRISELAYMDGVRGKLFWFPSHPYPYTIEYSYTIENKNPLIRPYHYFYNNYSVSIEKSGLQIIIPDHLRYKFKTRNLTSSTDSITDKNKTILTWQEENIPAKMTVPFEPSYIKTQPVVFFNASNFEIDGYKGSTDTWQSFGRWIQGLNEGRDILDPGERQKILSLVNGISDQREKVRILYKYLQDNTRYFNISYGIGGYQPASANEVAKNGYGDCKALTNYMRAILKTAGIESYYTLVMAGDGYEIEHDFPSNQFNHVILCVPGAKDTIWLECTNQEAPFGYLGGFTCDRYVLAITPDGGKLLRTPAYGVNDNKIFTFSNIKLESDGNASANIKLINKGLHYDELLSVTRLKNDEQVGWLAGIIGPATFNVERMEFVTNNEDAPTGQAEIDIIIRDLSARSSDRLFFTPCIVNNYTWLADEPVQFEIDISEHVSDSVIVEIPEGYVVEYLPEYKSNSSVFGKCDYYIESVGRIITFRRDVEFYKGLYDKERYGEFNEFINELARMDREMVVIRKL